MLFFWKKSSFYSKKRANNDENDFNYVSYLGNDYYNNRKKFDNVFNYSDYEYSLNNDNYIDRAYNKDYVITVERKKDIYSDRNWLFFPYDKHIGKKINANEYINDGTYFFLFELIEQD